MKNPSEVVLELFAQATELLSPVGSTKTLLPGETLCETGKPTDFAYLLEKGLVKITLPSVGPAIAAVYPAGHFIGLNSTLTGVPASFTATAITPCTTLRVSAGALDKLWNAVPAFRRAAVRFLDLDRDEAYAQLIALRTTSGEERLLRTLTDFAEWLSDPRTPEEWVRIPLKKEELAHLVGVYPQSLSRMLKKFKLKGIIREEGQRIIFVNNSIRNKYE